MGREDPMHLYYTDVLLMNKIVQSMWEFYNVFEKPHYFLLIN